ncbi:MAG: caspase family protein [Thiolinea sp.]
MSRKSVLSITVALGLSLSACSGNIKRVDLSKLDGAAINEFLIVDCLLPGRVRQLGTSLTYLGPRRAIRTSGSDCAIRGGEYVAADRANYETSLRIWQPLAEAGDLKAQTYVGEIYEKGLGVQPDYQRAAQWYEKAARQGYSRAKMNLGSLYERGLGVSKNTVQALNLYRDASGLGSNQLEFVSAEQRAERIAQAAQLTQTQRALQGTRSQVDQLQREVNQLKAEANRLRNAPPKIETRTVTKTVRVKDPEQERIIQQLNREVAGLRAQANQNRSQISRSSSNRSRELQAQNARLQQELARKQAEITRRQAQLNKQVAPAQPQRPLTRSAQKPSAETQRRIAALERQIAQKEKEVQQRSAQTASRPRVAETTTRAPAVSTPKKALRGVNFGKYYAVLIGNNNYTNAPQLQTAVNDAKAVGKILKNKYGFRTVVLANASRAKTLASLNSLRKRLKSQDNLIIYYAGHGELQGSKGFWLPADASATDKSTWISNEQITNFIESMSAKHVLVVADSCYSGTLSRLSIPRPVANTGNRTREWFNTVARTKVRVVMSSGGVKPVLDSGGGSHSVFASAFLKALRGANSVVEGAGLYQALRGQVSVASSALGSRQSPVYAPIKHAGHEAGDFIFLQGGRVAGLEKNRKPERKDEEEHGAEYMYASRVSVIDLKNRIG